MSREQDYRVIDSLYRLHEDLYQIEDAVLRSAVGQVRLATIRTNSVIATVIAAFLVVLPIVLTVTDLEWDDLPAIWGYIVALGLFVLLGFQIRDAKQTARKLRITEEYYKRTPLERRFDYTLERINANGVRIRALDDLLTDLRSNVHGGSTEERARLEVRIARWEEVRRECQEEIRSIVDDSALQVAQKKRFEADHTILADWAKPFLE